MYQYISTLKTITWRKYYNQYQQADNRNHAIYVTGKKKSKYMEKAPKIYRKQKIKNPEAKWPRNMNTTENSKGI